MREGWKKATLGDVLALIRNGTNCEQTKVAGGVKISRIETIAASAVNPDKVGYATLTENQKSNFKLRVDDILFSHINSAPHVGKTAIVKQNHDIYHGINLLLFRPTDEVDPRYLQHYLTLLHRNGYWRGVCKQSVNQASVNQTDIKKVPIPYPKSLSEQRRIVGILDQAFDGIDTAVANAAKNLASARELFDCQVSSIFINRGIGWQDRKLDQVCIVERGSSPRPIQDYFTTELSGVNWIKIGDTEEGGKYVYKTAQKITPEGAKKSRRVDEGDFILTNSMSFGRPYLMKTSGYIHDGWFVLRLNDTIDSEYFYYLLSSSFVQSQFAQLASGSVVKNISGDLVKKAVLPIPPLAQQQVIVSQLLKASSETTRLEAIYQQKVSSLERLRQAILQKALAGKLAARSANALPEAAE